MIWISILRGLLMENVKDEDLRYSDFHKNYIRGDDCCPFWRIEGKGTCAAIPEKGLFKCPADKDGNGCTVFPVGNEDREPYEL